MPGQRIHWMAHCERVGDEVMSCLQTSFLACRTAHGPDRQLIQDKSISLYSRRLNWASSSHILRQTRTYANIGIFSTVAVQAQAHVCFSWPDYMACYHVNDSATCTEAMRSSEEKNRRSSSHICQRIRKKTKLAITSAIKYFIIGPVIQTLQVYSLQQRANGY